MIIVLTDFDFTEYREAAYCCGASYFFAKGKVSREDILGVVGFYEKIRGSLNNNTLRAGTFKCGCIEAQARMRYVTSTDMFRQIS